MAPDIDHLILDLIAYRHRHNIQTAGYYLDPTKEWPVRLGDPFNQLTCYVIDLDSDMGWLVQGERNGGVGAKSITFGREDPWLAGQ